MSGGIKEDGEVQTSSFTFDWDMNNHDLSGIFIYINRVMHSLGHLSVSE